MYRHILIPTDGSVLADRAITQGLSLAESIGAKVTALIVEASIKPHDVPALNANEMSRAFVEHVQHTTAHAAKILSGVAAAARAAGVPCKTVHIINDDPYQGIIATANEMGCDLIVMASHGRSGLAAVVLGSITTKVLTHTTIPVLVCH